MVRRRIDGCKQQFPDCPENIDTSCRSCPYYKDGLKRQESIDRKNVAEKTENQTQPLNINV